MSDRYAQIANSRLGRLVVRRAGLPAPALLERHEPGRPVVEGTVLLGGADGERLAAGHPFAATGGRIVANLAKTLDRAGGGRGVISICAAGGQGVVAILEK